MSEQDGTRKEPVDLHAQAAAWLARLSSGDATRAERDAFRDWYARDIEHARAFDEISRLWQGLGDVLSARPSVVQARRTGGHLRTSGRLIRASVFGVALALLWAAMFPDLAWYAFVDYSTAIGQQETIRLADGTLVHMNSNTRLDVDYSASRRDLRVWRGEAAFEAVRDPRRPFRVISGRVETEALGTQFTVRYDGRQGSVTLTDGRVQVRAIEERADNGHAAAILTPGHRIAFTAARLDAPKAVDLDAANAWRRGRLVMNFVTLREVIDEINRYHRGRIVLLDDELGERQMNVAVDLAGIDDWLTGLENTLPLRVTRLGDLLVLLRPRA
jgi:transmembrane sensor